MQLPHTLILIWYNSNLILISNLISILISQIIDRLVISFYLTNILSIIKVLVK